MHCTSVKASSRMQFPKRFALTLLLALGGCATLPSSGPTGSQIEKSAQNPKLGTDFKVVELTDFAAIPPAPAQP